MIKIVTSSDELMPLKESWDNLASAHRNPLLQYNWFYACAKHLHINNTLYVVVVYIDNTITGIAPLAKVERNGLIWLEVIGSSTLHEPTGLIYKDETSLGIILAHLRSQRFPFVLSRIVDKNISKRSSGLLSYSGITLSRSCSGSSYITSNDSWDNYFGTISSRRRSDYRRAIRRAEKLGVIETLHVKPDTDTLSQLLETAFTIEASGWKHRNGTAIIQNANVMNFFKFYSQTSCKTDELRIFFLKIGNNIVAMQLGIIHANQLWVLKIGFDEQWKQCSPGLLLTMDTIKYCFDQKLDGYEFLGSDEPWLAIWPRKLHTYYNYIYYPFSLTGVSGFAKDIYSFITSKFNSPKQPSKTH